MRVAYITTNLIPSADAQSVQMYQMAQAFARRTEFVFVSPATGANEVMHPRFDWVRLKCPRLRGLRDPLMVFGAARELRRRRWRDAVVYTRNIFVAVAFDLMGFRTAYEMHKPMVTLAGKLLFAHLRCRQIRVVTISHSLGQYVTSVLRIPEHRVLVAHDGVELSLYATAKRDPELFSRLFPSEPRSRVVAVYCGSLQKGKGVDLILEAAARLRDVTFVVIGGTEPLVREYRRKAASLSNVTFLGHMPHEETVKYVVSADVLLMPYTVGSETYKWMSPLKMFEYMAAGVPIVASRVGTIQEVLDESAAVLFEATSGEALARGIEQVRSNYSEAMRRAQVARKKVMDYTWDRRAQRILHFLVTR